MKCTIAVIGFSFILFSFPGCRKDKNTIPPVAAPVLAVKLNQAYLSAAQVDSAFAIWKLNGMEQRIKMTVRNDSLIAAMSLFNEGNGELTLHIFSNKKYSNQHYAQWLSKKTVQLQKNKTVGYSGPVSFYDIPWFPRVEIADGIGHRAIVGLRPDDPFFLVKDPEHNIFKLSVDRGYWKTIGGIQLAGRGIWSCAAGCTDVANTDYFKFLPGAIGTKPWNHISIVVLFEINDIGEGWLISLEHEP